MRKQIFVLILILLLTVAVLVGCNGSKEEATPTTEEPTGSITETSTAPSTLTEAPSEDVPQTTETEPTEESEKIEETAGNTENKTLNPTTGDKIGMCFVVLVLASVGLIVLRNKNKYYRKH